MVIKETCDMKVGDPVGTESWQGVRAAIIAKRGRKRSRAKGGRKLDVPKP